jgi:hypothetical protein
MVQKERMDGVDDNGSGTKRGCCQQVVAKQGVVRQVISRGPVWVAATHSTPKAYLSLEGRAMIFGDCAHCEGGKDRNLRIVERCLDKEICCDYVSRTST